MSFNKVETWFRTVNEQAPANAMRVLVANKIDLDSQRVIQKSQGQEIAKKYDMKYFEVSAKSGIGVMDMYDGIVCSLSE
jgi:GTPase SAR1 family protein